MNERTWLTTSDALAMLAARHPARSHGSIEPQSRRARMYLLACARRAWGRLPAVCRALVELTEAYADAPVAREPLRAALAPVAEGLLHCGGEDGELRALLAQLAQLSDRGRAAPAAPPAPAERFAPAEWRGLAALVYLPLDTHAPTFTWVPRHLHSARLVREVYGNPYRNTPFDDRWRTADAVGVARRIHDTHGFADMPILADALQDAGCDSADVLDHCRDPKQVHVRGCWVLDRVLDLR